MTRVAERIARKPKRPTHTPGPWKQDDKMASLCDSSWLVLHENKKGEKTVVACVWKTDDGISDFSRDEVGQANARLIATAPELLEAASWVVRLFGTSDPRGLEDLKEKVAELRAVVGKARGTV